MSYSLDSKRLDIVKYYSIPFDGIYSDNSLDELILNLEQNLVNAVERQLVSDVPVGFFLSGGLDSSLIAAIAQKLRPENPINCFTIGFSENDGEADDFGNDTFFAKFLAEKLGFNLTTVRVNNNLVNRFDEIIWHLDEPQADSAPYNVLRICEVARSQGIKVLVGGTGGDDLFSGYRRHQMLIFEKILRILPSFIVVLFKNFLRLFNVKNLLIRRAMKFLNEASKNKLSRLVGYYSWLPHDRVVSLFSKEFRSKLANLNEDKYFIDLLNSIPLELHDLNRMLYWELKTFLPNHNLNYTDKMSMAAGVEVRVPFLDLDLVNFSAKIPVHYKMKGVTTKFLLRKVAEKYLPIEIINRGKLGFGSPVRKWFTRDLDGFINERLCRNKIIERGIFDPDMVLKLIEDNKSGKIDASYTILSLIAIDSWLTQFVDNENDPFPNIALI